MPPSGIFLETLIHDFDTLRHLNPGAEPVEVYAVTDALAYPDCTERRTPAHRRGASIRFDNGAMATAEASFNAVYGYDIRGEVFGSAGMVTAGDPRRTTIVHYGAEEVAADTWRPRHRPVPRRLHRRAGRLRGLRPHRRRPRPHRAGRRAALAIALAAIRSAETGGPVRLAEVDRP